MKRFFSFLMIILLICGVLAPLNNVMAEEARDDNFQSNTIWTEGEDYVSYLTKYSDAEHPDEEINVDIINYEGYGVEKWKENSVVTAQSSEYTVSVNVLDEGFYNIKIKYLVPEGNGNNVERKLLIDGELPFASASTITLFRLWKNSDETIYTDSIGNEYRPIQIEETVWQEAYIKSYDDYVNGAYSFYFTKGTHKLTFKGSRESLAIGGLTLCQMPKSVSYKETMNSLEKSGKKIEKIDTKPIKLEGEDALYKSEKILFPYADYSSSSNSPYSPTKTMLNMIGGINWKTNGGKLTWKFNVEESGYYQISMRVRQNYNSGTYAVRRLEIDNNVPFTETEYIYINYDLSWQMFTISDDEKTPYYFYLEKGEHIISLETAYGSLVEVLQEVDTVLSGLNDLYRDILMITGSNPDTLRDYNIVGFYPDCEKQCLDYANQLNFIIKKITKISGEKGSQTAALERLAIQLESFAKDAEEIPQQMSNFSSNISALATWLGTTSQMAVELDYIYISPIDSKLPKANASWWRAIYDEIVRFICSFTFDYNNINADTDSDKTPVSVWVNLGRDQATVIQSIVANDFTPKTGIPVNMRLISPEVLLRAVASGTGPDVTMYLDSATISNYALRGALYDLSEFDDYKQAASQFEDWQTKPFYLEGGNYALPEQMNFPMLFCRNDILSELNVNAPKTWNEFYDVLAVLNKSKLQIGIPSSFTAATNTVMSNVFLSLLYQNGGDVYSSEQDRCVLNSKAGVNSFEEFCELYTKYGFDQKIDLLTRFRMGEAPIVINNYTFANELAVSAQEINGLWSVHTLPGTIDEDGNVDFTSVASITGYVIFKNAKSTENAWEFLKWITSVEGQTAYGLEMEALQGVSGRWPSANIKAINNFPYSTKNLEMINSQIKSANAVSEIAGGYYTGRSVNNAIRTVVNNNDDPKETLYDYVEEINEEIMHKREELGLE